MIIKNENIYKEAHDILRKGLNNPKANFREGQYEAIEAVFTNRRSLVVQKTGWGKSFVYFISTKINRNKNKGVSIVISPLLVLIENQIEAAEKLELKCEAIYHGNKDEHADIIERMKENEIDIVFTTPESLFNILRPHIDMIQIGMFIIDEVHCISDWGHDFRLDYRRIVQVLNQLKNSNFPVLATTATANNRVIEDLKEQIGPNLFISRGSLFRDNLYVQIIDLKSKVNRYGWILNHINDFNGIGIIYCLTTSDCDNLTKFLQENNINALSYHSSLDSEVADENIKLFVKNKIKVLVSTIKLGMGYDKPDVSFIIHYQVPKNIVSYYQQIGRAARNIKEGFAIMLKGGNDFDILNHFVDSSFPEKKEMEIILEQFDELEYDFNKTSLSSQGIAKNVNMSFQKINRALKFLEFDNILIREKQSYSLTGNKFVYNRAHYEEISKIKKNEIAELEELFKTNTCLNKKIINSLDDNFDYNCNNCSNCLKRKLFSDKIELKYIEKATQYLDNDYIVIKPRNKYKKKIQGTGQYQFPHRYGWDRGNYIPAEYFEKEILNGFALSKYGDDGIGQIIKEYKYSNKSYPEEVYVKAVRIINIFKKTHGITDIVFVPSLNNKLMDEFALELSKRTNLEFNNLFKKLKNTKQKDMQNYLWQIKNSKENYELRATNSIKNKVFLLIDDMIDSGYTLTYLGIKLLEAGAKDVVPMALADSGEKVIDND